MREERWLKDMNMTKMNACYGRRADIEPVPIPKRPFFSARISFMDGHGPIDSIKDRRYREGVESLSALWYVSIANESELTNIYEDNRNERGTHEKAGDYCHFVPWPHVHFFRTGPVGRSY